jgi:putative ABC transport system substrate-binding protein
MRRRDFITLLGGAAGGWPITARAQQPVIGWLGATSPAGFQPYLTAFRQGLRDQGFIEGQNIALEYRWAEG